MLDPLNVDVAVADELALPVQLRVQLGVLALAVVVDGALLVDLGAQRLDEADVGVHSRLVVLIHSALLFVETTEILLQIDELVLQRLVIALALSQLGRFFHQLRNHALFFGRLSCARASCCGVVRCGLCGSVLLSLLLLVCCFLLLGLLVDLGDVVLLYWGSIVRLCSSFRAVGAEWARVARIVANAVLLLLHGARFSLCFGYARSRL